MEKDKETEIVIQGLTLDFRKQMKLNGGAERHHYSMFNVGRSMLDVRFSKQLSAMV
jgi:hypothetical protein